MQPPASPSPAGRPPIEAAGNQEARLHLEDVDRLKTIVDAQVSEFGDSRYGTLVDNTKGLQAALETVDTSVAQGDLATGQSVLEQAPRPRKLNDEVRDTLADLHRTERGEPTPDQRHQAMSGLLLEVTRDIDTLTDPKKGNLRYTEPEVQAHKAVEAAFKERHRNYFDDIQPEGEVLQNGEQRTPHEVADDAYDLLLSYTEDKLRSPDLAAEKAESLRTARDLLHNERKGWKEQFDAQNEVAETVMGMVGKDNEQFSEARVKEAIRDCVGDEIPRLKELVEAARDTTDPHERFNILNSLQRQESPVKNAEAFEAWKQKRAEKAKAVEEQQSAELADNARKTIEAIQNGVEEPANQGELSPSVPPLATPENQESKEIVVAPVPTGWTELVHGTSSSRWQPSSETVEVTGAGISAISLEDIARGSGKTTDNYSQTRTDDGQPIEVRVSFYRDDLSPRRGVRPDAAELKAGLSPDTLALIARYHQDRHPFIPRGETLLKIGESVNADNGRHIEHYVPRSVAEQYVKAVKRETGRDIVLPASVEQRTTIEQPAQQGVNAVEDAQPKPAATETVTQAPEQARNPYEQFVKSALARVPQNVLLESITAVAQERLMDGQQVDINSLRQQLGQRLSRGLEIEPAKLEALAKRVQQNGFYESGGGIWQAQANSNTPQGRIAAEARNLVREILSQVV